MSSNQMNPEEFLWVPAPFKEVWPATIMTLTQEIMSSEPEFDFSWYITTCRKLPDHNFNGRTKELSYLAIQYLDKINNLKKSNPLINLKILLILIANMFCVFGAGYFKAHLHKNLMQWFDDESLSLKMRVEGATHCWIKLSNIVNDITQKQEMVSHLFPLFLRFAEKEPEFTLEQYDLINKNRVEYNSIFSFVYEDADEFLKFSYFFKDSRQILYIDGLCRILVEKSTEKTTEEKSAYYAIELFNILKQGELTANTKQKICQILILYGQSDEPWYQELPLYLWSEELQRAECFETERNSLITILNYQDETLVEKPLKLFRFWLSNYKNNTLIRPRVWRVHTLKYFIDEAYRIDFSSIRNRQLIKPYNAYIVDEMIDNYWEMVNWAQGADLKLYSYLLETGLQTDRKHTEKLRELGAKAKLRLVEEFQILLQTSIEDSKALVAGMIGNTYYTDKDSCNYQVIELVYEMLQKYDQDAANLALKEGHRISGRHRRRWNPKSYVL